MSARVCSLCAGKSTLLKLMVGELSATEGAIRKHLHLSIARYNQHSNDQLDPTVNVLDFIRSSFPDKKMEVTSHHRAR